MKKNNGKPIEPSQNSRREFLAGGALLGAMFVPGVARAAASTVSLKANSVFNSERPDAAYQVCDPAREIYTACLQCNTGCGIKCKLQDGVAVKIDGNPYSPWTLLPHLPMSVSAFDAAAVDGSICPKGQAGMQTAYDPYRIRKVLKRAGKRGENKWISISFEQAIAEICDGGTLFANVPGEESRQVAGLRELMALTDSAAAKAMGDDIKAYWDEKDKEKKAALLLAFKEKYAGNLGTLIDAEHPDLGPRNNQIVVSWGRLKGGRSDFYRRFAAALGTVNAHGHTTVCQGSLYFTCKAISEQYDGGKFTGGKKFYWQADTENSKFILFVGANLLEANYGPTNRAVRLTDNLATGATKIAVVDPRFGKLASKAWKWLPIAPGTDGAMAMAFIRWMLDNNRFDARFLACANKAAAVAAGENSWTNATWLIEIKDGKPGKFVRAADIGLCAAETRQNKDGKDYEEKFLVAMVGGVPTVVDPNSADRAVDGDLFVDATLPNGTQVKSGLQILKEAASQRSFAEWAAITSIAPAELEEVVRELTSYGKLATVDIHRGVAQHTNGFYNVLGWMTVNMLLGNFDAKGGMITQAAYDTMGKGKLFDLSAHPGVVKGFGISSIRHDLAYEKSSIFAGYPAKRNWYPLASDVYEELVPSIGDAYPYPVKALFMYMGAPTYALPAGHTNIEILCDTEKLPLFVCNDILVGPTSMYADYIFPDTSYLERWEFQGSHPNIAQKVQPVRQPAIAPLVEECSVYGQPMPINFESLMLGIAERLGLPGFGEDAFGPGLAFKHQDDFYLRSVANLAFGEAEDGSKAVADASPEEQALLVQARAHLPESVFSEARWRATVGDALWPKVVHVLNRGGRFQKYEDGYKDSRAGNPYAALLNLYQEKTAGTVYAGTGEKCPGYATYVPVQSYTGQDPASMRQGYDLHLITHRTITQTKSRTIVDYWLTQLEPSNGLLINPADAQRLGLQDGDTVKITSATNPEGVWPLGNGKTKAMTGKVIVTPTLKPGVISFTLGYGHWASGAQDMVIDGHEIKGEQRRAAGIHANAAMWTDPVLKNTCMFDPVGGSVSFYDTQVKLAKV